MRPQQLDRRLQPRDGGLVGQRVGQQQLQAIADQPHAVAAIDGVLQLPQRGALLFLELAQALVGVQWAVEGDRFLATLTLPSARRRAGRRRNRRLAQEAAGMAVAWQTPAADEQ